MSKAMIKRRKELFDEYRKEYPHLLKKPLARLLVAEHPDMFSDVESARDVVRRYTGTHGAQSRKHGKKPKPTDHKAISEEYYLPDGDKEVIKHQLPTGYARVGITGDWQMPYHDKDAIVKIFEKFIQEKINCLYLNGDIIDCVTLSSFCRDPNARNFSYELDLFFEYMSYARDIFGDIPIYYKLGNHEDRYQRYMYQKSKMLLGVPEFDFEYVMAFNDFKIKKIEAYDLMFAGDMPIIHGHEHGGWGSTINPAKNMYNKIKSSFIMGHGHIRDSYRRKRVTGEQIECHMHGSACQLSPAWKPMAYTDWSHGAAILYRDSKGNTVKVDNFGV